MAENTNTLQFLLDAANAAYSTLRRGAGDRAQSVVALLAATTDDERDQVVVEWGAALLRRSLRVTALSFAKDEETANVFWTLRDLIEDDGFNADLAGDEDSTVDDEEKVLVAA